MLVVIGMVIYRRAGDRRTRDRDGMETRIFIREWGGRAGKDAGGSKGICEIGGRRKSKAGRKQTSGIAIGRSWSCAFFPISPFPFPLPWSRVQPRSTQRLTSVR